MTHTHAKGQGQMLGLKQTDGQTDEGDWNRPTSRANAVGVNTLKQINDSGRGLSAVVGVAL